MSRRLTVVAVALAILVTYLSFRPDRREGLRPYSET
jgi:hypothetical protein